MIVGPCKRASTLRNNVIPNICLFPPLSYLLIEGTFAYIQFRHSNIINVNLIKLLIIQRCHITILDYKMR